MSELEACRSEGRNYSSEVYRLKASYDETMEQLDVVRRENKVAIHNFSLVPSLILNTSRTLLTRSRIFLTNLATVAGPSTTWTSREGDSRWRRRSYRELSRRPREPSSRRRTRWVATLREV